ncbi:hypothetical protein GGF31_008130 [Allomyces arbusculus]|nr:hypothetical protein GGF31_008130 [Allomyces arbusculus]
MEHLDTIPADVLTARLATLLDRLIAAADRAAAAAAQVPSPPSSGRSVPALRRTRSAAVVTTTPTSSSKSVATTSPFHAKTVPPIALRAYLARMARYAPCPNVVFVAVLVYLDRVAAARTRPVALVAATAHRLALTAVVVATKFWSDVFYTNAHYAKVGGVPTAELNRLEMEFLFRAGFELAIDPRDLDEVAGHLLFDEPVEVGQFTAAIPAAVRPFAQVSWTSVNETDSASSAGAAGAYVSPHRSPPDSAAYHAAQESTASYRGYPTAWPHPGAAYAAAPPAAAAESSTPHRAYPPVSAPQWIDSVPPGSGSHTRCDSALGYGLEFAASPVPEIVVQRERSGSLGEPLAIAGTLATRGGSATAAAAPVTNGTGRPWPSPPDAAPRGAAAAAAAAGATRGEAVLIDMPYAAPAAAVHSIERRQFPSHPRPPVVEDDNNDDDQGERLPMPLPTLPRAPRGAAVHTPVGPSRLPSMLSLATAATRSPSPAHGGGHGLGHDYASLARASLDRRQSAPVLRRVASSAVVAPPLASPVRMGGGGGRVASVVNTPSPHRAATGGVGKVGTVAGRGEYPYPSASAGMGRDQGHGRHQAPHQQYSAPYYPLVTHQQQYAPSGALQTHHHQCTGHAVPGPAPPSSAHHHHHVSYTASSSSQYAHYPTAQTPQYPSNLASRTPQYASVPYPTSSSAHTPQYPTSSSSSSTAATPHVHPPPSHPRMAIPPPSRIASHAPSSSSIPVLAPLRSDSASSSSTLTAPLHHNPTPPPSQQPAYWTPSRRGSLVADLPPVTALHAPPRTVSKRTSAQVLRPAAPGESPLRRRASIAHLGAAYHAERTDPKQYAYRAQQTAHATAQQQGGHSGGQQRIGPYGAVSSLMLVG